MVIAVRAHCNPLDIYISISIYIYIYIYNKVIQGNPSYNLDYLVVKAPTRSSTLPTAVLQGKLTLYIYIYIYIPLRNRLVE